MKLRSICVLMLVLLATIGCANMSTTQQRALSGGAIGAGGGALVGVVTGGNPAVGAAIGGGVGAAAGAISGEVEKKRRR
ncbi:MAG: glycine zipper domain-containing protein [Candidatus Tectimicrobiota bacterium]